MHTKREMVCTCLPEAMLINSTTLTMTRMAPSRTALRGIWALVSAVQRVQRPAYLNASGAHPVFFPKSGQKIRRGGLSGSDRLTRRHACLWIIQVVSLVTMVTVQIIFYVHFNEWNTSFESQFSFQDIIICVIWSSEHDHWDEFCKAWY